MLPKASDTKTDIKGQLCTCTSLIIREFSTISLFFGEGKEPDSYLWMHGVGNTAFPPWRAKSPACSMAKKDKPWSDLMKAPGVPARNESWVLGFFSHVRDNIALSLVHFSVNVYKCTIKQQWLCPLWKITRLYNGSSKGTLTPVVPVQCCNAQFWFLCFKEITANELGVFLVELALFTQYREGKARDWAAVFIFRAQKHKYSGTYSCPNDWVSTSSEPFILENRWCSEKKDAIHFYERTFLFGAVT